MFVLAFIRSHTICTQNFYCCRCQTNKILFCNVNTIEKLVGKVANENSPSRQRKCEKKNFSSYIVQVLIYSIPLQYNNTDKIVNQTITATKQKKKGMEFKPRHTQEKKELAKTK